AIVPLLSCSGPLLFFMYTSYYQLNPGPYAAFIGTGLTSITLFNPLTTIFFVRCYRDAMVCVLFPCRRKKAPVAPNTAVTGLSLATGWGQLSIATAPASTSGCVESPALR
ncbi:hypothetical protein AAVH_41912, partial [Aphelenchoides avenae]